MSRTRAGRLRGVAVALAATLALTGCTIPFVNIEVPFELPDLSGFNLPEIDVSDLDLPRVTLPFGVQESVDDAREKLLADHASTVDPSALLEEGTLTVGVKCATSSAPLCVEGDAGSVYGLDVDVAAALASEMGLRVRYVPVTDGSSLGTECDVIMNGRSGNPDAIAIAGTYVESATCFFHRGDAVVSAATDLGGKSVGVQGGSVSETVLNRTGLKMSQRSFVNLNEAFDALAAGEIDYVLCEAFPGAYLASLHGGISFAGALEAPETSGVAVSAKNAELVSKIQVAFDTLSSNGVLEIARTRWVGSLPALTADSQIQGVPSGSEDTSATSPEQASDEGSTDGSDAGSNAVTNVG